MRNPLSLTPPPYVGALASPRLLRTLSRHLPRSRSPPTATPTRKVSFFGAKKQAESLITENERLEALIAQYGLNDVSQLDDIKRGINDQISAAEQELARLRAEAGASEAERAQVQDEIVNLRDTAHLQEYGLFDFENPAESSVALATELESVRSEIKRLVRTGDATVATSNFTFNNSAAKGRKFVNDRSKLLLRAYNAEAENCIKTVRAGNLVAAQKRISTASTQVERLGTMRCGDPPRWRRLRAPTPLT